MDDTLFEEILNEIDLMSSEEYWAFYREAKKLPDFNLLIPADLNTNSGNT
ncbi:hypothetical protein LQZ19_00170 [Treponema primitia]